MRRIYVISAVVLLPVFAFGYALANGNSAPVRDRVFDITVINTFQCPYATEIMGLDYVNGENALTFASNLDDALYTCNADNGTYISALTLNYTGNPHPFGVCYDGNGYPHINDFSGSKVYWTDYAVWDYYSNPAGNKGRGMDFYGAFIWETYSTEGVYRFLPDGTNEEYYPVSDVGAQMSGLAVFPYNGNTWLMLSTHGVYLFYYYEFDGSTLTYVGADECPLEVDQSYGLTFAAERGTFFWSYTIEEAEWVAELDIGLDDDSAVVPASMGVVKAMYR